MYRCVVCVAVIGGRFQGHGRHGMYLLLLAHNHNNLLINSRAWIDQVPLSTSLIKALRQSHKVALISVLELNQKRSTNLIIQEKKNCITAIVVSDNEIQTLHLGKSFSTHIQHRICCKSIISAIFLEIF